MEFTILDVGHGFCACLRADNGNVMLFDCGHKSYPEFRPSSYLASCGIQRVDCLFITNYDEDHISDLPRLREHFSISVLHKNPSISPPQLRQLKAQSGPISEAMMCLLRMCETYTNEITAPPVFPAVVFWSYWNKYPSFTDTNNLSLVTFLACNDTTFLIPGDLETPGWEALLSQAEFRTNLGCVNVFVASHHGRESGYCREVFDYCSPSVVIFSDSEIKHATQEMTTKYGEHASGTPFRGDTRYVLTTRNDGSLTWNV